MAGWKFGGWAGKTVGNILNNEKTKALAYLRSFHPDKKQITIKELLTLPKHLHQFVNATNELEVRRYELERLKFYHAVYIVISDTKQAALTQAKIDFIEHKIISLESQQAKGCDRSSATPAP